VLITGALGSGKTSLLSAILGKRTLRNSVVLINEFGAMGLDGDGEAMQLIRTDNLLRY